MNPSSNQIWIKTCSTVADTPGSVWLEQCGSAVEQCGLEYEWIGMQQRGRMQAALRVTAVRNREAAAATPATAPMPSAAPQQLRVGLEPEQSQPEQLQPEQSLSQPEQSQPEQPPQQGTQESQETVCSQFLERTPLVQPS